MRIIAGKHKGRQLFYEKRPGLRPTAARVKEALFNILGPAIIGQAFLDLFAGGGGIGLEALSRGATPVVFGELEPQNCQLIRKNLTTLGEEGKICQGSYEKTLKILARENYLFSYVFLDPGYQTGLATNCLQGLDTSSIISEITTIIAEHATREVLPASFTRLYSTRQVAYGDTCLTFYRLNAKE